MHSTFDMAMIAEMQAAEQAALRVFRKAARASTSTVRAQGIPSQVTSQARIPRYTAPMEAIRAVAFHELSHAAAAVEIGCRVEYVQVNDDGTGVCVVPDLLKASPRDQLLFYIAGARSCGPWETPYHDDPLGRSVGTDRAHVNRLLDTITRWSSLACAKQCEEQDANERADEVGMRYGPGILTLRPSLVVHGWLAGSEIEKLLRFYRA